MNQTVAAFSLGSILLLGGAAAPPATPPATRPAARPVAATPATVPSAPAVVAPPAAAPARAEAFAVALGPPFESQSAGISLRPPADVTALRQVDSLEVIRFVDDLKAPTRTLAVSTRFFPQPMNLTATPDGQGRVRPGILQDTVGAVQKQYPGCEVLRQNLTNLGDKDVAMIVFRYTRENKDFLAQQAIVQANDQFYYVLSMSSPGRKAGASGAEDPDERQAVETFRAVLDSVRLLDRAKIRADQVDRFFRTRALLYNLTERKLAAAVVPEQWRRILKQTPGGLKDVGYQYVVEQPDRKANQDGINVGIRTRLMTDLTPDGRVKPFPREDTESKMFTTADRHHEDWTTQTAVDPDGKPKSPANPWQKVTEFGSADMKTSHVPAVAMKDRDKPENQFKKGEIGDAKNPWMNTMESYTLSVQYAGTKGDLSPVTRPLGPFYLPQALTTMLPRLLPPEPKTYLFAGYVSDAREVVLRYVDVGREQDVTLAGRRVRAVPVTDRYGLEGVVTTHYVDAKGAWLGSETKDAHLLILPTTRQELSDLWNTQDLFQLADPGGDVSNPDRPAAPAAAPVNRQVPGTIAPERPRPVR